MPADTWRWRVLCCLDFAFPDDQMRAICWACAVAADCVMDETYAVYAPTDEPCQLWRFSMTEAMGWYDARMEQGVRDFDQGIIDMFLGVANMADRVVPLPPPEDPFAGQG